MNSPKGTRGAWSHARSDRSQTILLSALISLAVTILLIGLKSLLESTDFGTALEQMGANLLQRRLSAASHGRPVSVIVVDLSGLSLAPAKETGELETPRAPLLQVVRSLAAADPEAIGIDIIFEPDPHGQLKQEDADFLDACLRLTGTHGQPIPILVGVADSVVRGPNGWLGDVRFASLAASVLVPRPKDAAAVDRMFSSLSIAGEGANIHLTSLSSALARSTEEVASDRRRWARGLSTLFPHLIEQQWWARTGPLEAREFLIDFGPLEQLQDGTVTALPLDSLTQRLGFLTGKVVLAGRAAAHSTNDQFIVPNRGEPVSGVYVHASALETLLRAPISRLTERGRFVADFAISLAMIATIFVIEWRGRKSASEHSKWLPTLGMSGMALVVFLTGYLWLDSIGIYWTDFLVVLIALLLHPAIERQLHRMLGAH